MTFLDTVNKSKLVLEKLIHYNAVNDINGLNIPVRVLVRSKERGFVEYLLESAIYLFC